MARIHPILLDGVVSIEIDGPEGKQPIATGFLFGRYIGKDQDGDNLYRVFLITNRHVFENPRTKQKRQKVALRFNVSGEQPATRYYDVNLLDKFGNAIWIGHSEDAADVAVLPINVQRLTEEKIKFFFFTDNEHSYLMAEREAHGIATGDGVFVLGFPMGIRDASQNFVIARKGIIARVDEEVLKEHYFFVDVSAYPGNSGGPVVIEAELSAVQGTKAVSQTRLIGIVSAGIPYREAAVSPITGEPRIIFQEQTGLVKVVPIDSLIQAIDAVREPEPAEKAIEAPVAEKQQS